jgi:hypothetical protein
MNFFPPNKSISLPHSRPLTSVSNEIKFRPKSLIFYPVHSLKAKNEIDDITNKAVPIAITQVTTDDPKQVVTNDLKGSGIEPSVLHAFKHPAGKFYAEDSAEVGHTSLYREREQEDKNVPSSSKKIKIDEALSGKGSKKTPKGKKTKKEVKHELRII